MKVKDNVLLSRLTDAIKLKWQNYNQLSSKEKMLLWGDFLVRNAIYIIIVMVVIYVQIYSIQNNFSNAFLSFKPIMDILKRSAAYLFVALGVGGIIVLT
jgi:ABC-type glucose/galactose transport system permease subunit